MRQRGVILGLVLVTGCVTTGTYNAKVAELEAVREQHDRDGGEREAKLKDRIATLEASVKDVGGRLAQCTAERDALRKNLDDNTALVTELKKRLEKVGQNVDALSSERGQLAGALADAKQRLEDLRKQKATAEAMAATFRNLVEKLHSMIDSGKLRVVIRDGRMQIALPNDVLFDSGRSAVKAEAQASLSEVAQVLSAIPDRRFVVAGHTDNVPIHTERFASNWELSTARAVEVTKFLIAHGMPPQTLAAAGYGEFDPVASNDMPDTRALNRRIEIVLQPNLAELPSLEGLVPNTPH